MRQLLYSVPDGGRCRNKGRNGDDLSFHKKTVAHVMAHLEMPLEDVLSMTVALGGAECCVLRLPEGQGPPNFGHQNPTKQ